AGGARGGAPPPRGRRLRPSRAGGGGGPPPAPPRGCPSPPMARLIPAALLPNSPFSYTGRLTASIGLALLLLPVPVRLVIDDLMGAFTQTGTSIVDIGSLVGQLGGWVVLALAAAGLWGAR